MKNDRTGTTLIELTVALSLASLLMISINGVLTSMQRRNQSIQFNKLEDVQHDFRSLLWNDLSQARTCSFREGVLWLEMPGATANDQEGQQLVAYQLIEKDSLPPRLVRQESNVSNDSTRRRSTQQTVFWNVVGLTFERLDSTGVAQPIPTSMGPTPKGIRYSLQLLEREALIQGDIAIR